MKNVVKTILYSYPMLDEMIEGIDKLVLHKAVTSYTDCTKTLKQIDNIILLQNKADRIEYLKKLTNRLLNSLSDEEKSLIEYKYFRRKMPNGFDYTSRKYFRKQKRVATKIMEKAQRLDMSEDWFMKNFSDIDFLHARYTRFKNADSCSEHENAAKYANF